MILAFICIGLPCLILAFFLWECHQHQRELEKAGEEFNEPARPRFTQWVGRGNRRPDLKPLTPPAPPPA